MCEQNIDFDKVFHWDVNGDAILSMDLNYKVHRVAKDEIVIGHGEYLGGPNHCETCQCIWPQIPDLLLYVLRRWHNRDGARN